MTQGKTSNNNYHHYQCGVLFWQEYMFEGNKSVSECSWKDLDVKCVWAGNYHACMWAKEILKTKKKLYPCIFCE